MRAYLRRVRDFAKYFMRPPEEIGETKVRQFLPHLAQERKVSSSLEPIYVTALKSLYRITLRQPEVVENPPSPKNPKTLPEVLTMEKVFTLISAIKCIKYKAILATA